MNSRTNTENVYDADADAVCYSACIVNLSNQSRKDIDWIYQITEHNITTKTNECPVDVEKEHRLSEWVSERTNWASAWERKKSGQEQETSTKTSWMSRRERAKRAIMKREKKTNRKCWEYYPFSIYIISLQCLKLHTVVMMLSVFVFHFSFPFLSSFNNGFIAYRPPHSNSRPRSFDSSPLTKKTSNSSSSSSNGISGGKKEKS